MIFRFIILKRLHWNDLQFFYFFKKIKKKFSYLSRFSGFLFSKYGDVAQIRFCAGFLFSKYDGVAQIRFCAAYIRWVCQILILKI